ncbi:ArgE/DapE family deacylase [Pelagibius sp. Alg239-R121]|uniref:ArgE/DapE family deacylase n=1 Tax=Pelagibius sp. Alg239-R121 TaxID=2993448 RepID=UPI0024A6CB37|nr:ArgE/DapE family deacylase [Pelagibius sp. Alg239-R121]
MLDETLSREILAAVDEGFGGQLAFTQNLVRFPSLRGQEHTAQDFLFEEMRARDLTMDRWAIEVGDIEHHPGFSPVKVDYSNAINVVGTHRPGEEQGRSLILNGHVDVVPTGPLDMWSKPPFDPHVEGDWLYGRGSGDMKAGIAANIFALDALKRLGFHPAARVHLQSVTEEECTGNGALSCLVRGYRADAAIIPEPMDGKLVRANVGVLWFRVHVRGVPVHVLEAGSGANAIEAAFPLISALHELEERWNGEKSAQKYFENLEHPINLNVGKIAGGDWASSVPAWCSFDCRISIYPGWNPAERAAEIESCLRAAAQNHPFLANNPPEVEWNGFFAEGYVLEEGSDAERLLERTHLASHGHNLESMVTPAYLDGRVFVLYDNCPCLVYGPYSEGIHGFDERVSLSSIKRVTGAIALFIAEWCGLERISDG